MVKIERNGDLIINGSGSTSGGTVNKVSINGRGTIHGNLDCVEFKINGAGEVQGNVKGDLGNINGNGSIDGNIEFNSFTIDGSGTIRKDAAVKEMKINGKGKIEGSVSGGEIRINGKATIGKDCEVDLFRSKGNFKIGGLLNSDLVDVTIFGECRATEIGGQTIKVRNKNFSILNLLESVLPIHKLIVDTIEGDEIEIENTHAKMVRGNNVNIGPNCEVEVVEYTGSFNQAENSKVKESRKI